MSTSTSTDDFDRDRFLSDEWPNALESGEFAQGRSRLAYAEPGQPGTMLYCCLGVACELLARKGLLEKTTEDGYVVYYDDNPSTLPNRATELLGIDSCGTFRVDSEYTSTLTTENDSTHMTFPEIAELIRNNYRTGRFLSVIDYH